VLLKVDDLRGPEIAKLLQEHLDNMASISPPESCHALDLDSLRKPEVTFWTVWEDEHLCGCGAIKELDKTHAEVKSMRTATPFLRRGVATLIVQRIVDTAKQRGYHRLSLETGSMKEFKPAIALYQRFGFVLCEPFEGYVEDPNSVFMTKVLDVY
jgi:putative acetyltransferase